MKTIKILLLLLLFVSCTNNNDEITTEPVQPIQKCGVVISITPIQITTINGTITRYRINATLNDNTTTFVIIDDGTFYNVGQNVCRSDW